MKLLNIKSNVSKNLISSKKLYSKIEDTEFKENVTKLASHIAEELNKKEISLEENEKLEELSSMLLYNIKEHIELMDLTIL